jgi:hypothetical protein
VRGSFPVLEDKVRRTVTRVGVSVCNCGRVAWFQCKGKGLDLAEPDTEVAQDEYSKCAAIYDPIYVL